MIAGAADAETTDCSKGVGDSDFTESQLSDLMRMLGQVPVDDETDEIPFNA